MRQDYVDAIVDLPIPQMHATDRMAREKLEEGIPGFSKTLEALELLLGERYRARRGQCESGEAARRVFEVYDLDGDDFITREEGGGSGAVFEALDLNGDGKILPEEMVAGLGAAFRLE